MKAVAVAEGRVGASLATALGTQWGEGGSAEMTLEMWVSLDL